MEDDLIFSSVVPTADINTITISSCQCPHSIVIMSGVCPEHNKKWETRIDATYIKELIERIEALEKIVSVLLVDDELKEKVKEIFNED